MNLQVNIESNAAGENPELFASAIRHFLEGVIEINRASIRAGQIGPLYQSGVVYQDEPPDYESIVDALTTYSYGVGDCAHLSAWRVAELREAGENASITIEWNESIYEPDFLLYHVQVRRGDGSIEDPSALLGMHSY